MLNSNKPKKFIQVVTDHENPNQIKDLGVKLLPFDSVSAYEKIISSCFISEKFINKFRREVVKDLDTSLAVPMLSILYLQIFKNLDIDFNELDKCFEKVIDNLIQDVQLTPSEIYDLKKQFYIKIAEFKFDFLNRHNEQYTTPIRYEEFTEVEGITTDRDVLYIIDRAYYLFVNSAMKNGHDLLLTVNDNTLTVCSCLEIVDNDTLSNINKGDTIFDEDATHFIINSIPFFKTEDSSMSSDELRALVRAYSSLKHDPRLAAEFAEKILAK